MAENASAQSIENRKHLKNVSDNYLSIWNGDLSLIDSTFAPKFAFHADRFPSPDGSQAIDINTPDEFRAFVSRARTGWDKYEFEVLAWAGHGNNVAVRWKLNAVMGANFTILPT
jgi:SnoaL-like domain